MPIDRELLRKQAEDNLTGLLKTQKSSIAGDLERDRGLIEGKRNPILSRAGSFASSLGLGGGANTIAKSNVSNVLNRNLNTKQSGRLLSESRDKINLIYQNAFRRAENSNLSRQEAEAYARQVASEEVRRQFQASQADKDRLSRSNIADVENEFNDRRVKLAEKYEGDTASIYEQALTRSLFGLGGGIATAYYAPRYLGNSNQTRQTVKNNYESPYQRIGNSRFENYA